MNAFENIFPAMYITEEESIPEPPDRTYILVAITEDGSFVDLAHLNQAKFLLPIDNGGAVSYIYTTGGAGTKFGEYGCTTGQDFTVTDGKITLDDYEQNIFEFPTNISLADMLYGQGS